MQGEWDRKWSCNNQVEQTQANFSLLLPFHLQFHLCEGILWKMHPAFLRLGKSSEASSRSKLRIDWSPGRVPFQRSFLGDKWALITEYCVTQGRHHHGAFPNLIFQWATPARKELNKTLGTSSVLPEHFPGGTWGVIFPLPVRSQLGLLEIKVGFGVSCSFQKSGGIFFLP